MGLILNILTEEVKKIYQTPALHWTDDVLTEKDKTN